MTSATRPENVYIVWNGFYHTVMEIWPGCRLQALGQVESRDKRRLQAQSLKPTAPSHERVFVSSAVRWISNALLPSEQCLDVVEARRVLDVGGGCVAVNLAHEPGKDRPGTHFNIRGDALQRKAADNLVPSDRC